MEPIERTFFDRCDIYSRGFAEENGRQKEMLSLFMEGVPCGLCYLQRQEAKADDRTFVDYLCTLFLPKGEKLPFGCGIRVFHEGEELWFEAAGEEKRYSSHREVTVKRRQEL